MSNRERDTGSHKEKSVMKSRLFKGGAVATFIGAGFGVGVLVELGIAAAAGAAGGAWGFGGPKRK